MKYVVMYSGGIGSWASARRLVDQHGPDNVICLFSDVKGNSTDPHVGEDQDTYRFITESMAQLGCEYVRVADGRDIWRVFTDERFLGNSRIASCSKLLKQAPAHKWLQENTTPETHTVVIGIDWTETHRTAAVVKAYDPYQVLFPMCEAPLLDKSEMITWSESLGIKPPRLYGLGFSHNNCGGGCVRAGQGQFKHLNNVMPERFNVWATKEQEIRDYLDRDVSILKDTRGGTTKTLTLMDLQTREEAQIDMFDLAGCGCFTDDP